MSDAFSLSPRDGARTVRETVSAIGPFPLVQQRILAV